MTAIILRFVIYAVIAGAVYLGVRKIWRDWSNQFRAEDKQKHQRDLKERGRPDVIDLKRSSDGVFRPPSSNDKSGSDRH